MLRNIPCCGLDCIEPRTSFSPHSSIIFACLISACLKYLLCVLICQFCETDIFPGFQIHLDDVEADRITGIRWCGCFSISEEVPAMQFHAVFTVQVFLQGSPLLAFLFSGQGTCPVRCCLLGYLLCKGISLTFRYDCRQQVLPPVALKE